MTVPTSSIAGNRSPALFILTVILCLFTFFCPGVSCSKTAKLLMVDSQEGEPYSSIRNAALEYLASHGYRQGRKLQMTYWSIGNAEGRAKRVWLSEKNNTYDAIYLGGTMATHYFQNHAYGNPDLKFVFGGVTDPVGLGVIDNFTSPPKANFTGVCFPVRVTERLRFVKMVLPDVKNIGYIYSAMPQSKSYNQWLKEALLLKEFKDIKIHFREVPFVPGEGGHIRMSKLAKEHVLELSPKVDVFLSPNDQMGAQKPFVETVTQSTLKPLIGLTRTEVMENWGTALSYYPSPTSTGRQIGKMLMAIFEGGDFEELIPQWPESGIAINLKRTRNTQISIPAEIMKKAGTDIVN